MTKILYIIFILILFSFNTTAYEIPDKNKINFDIIRKGKDIGDHIIQFKEKNDQLIVNVDIDIKVKLAFVVVYKFEHQSKEVWENGTLVSFTGKTKFEDDREYDVSIEVKDANYEGSGMDGSFTFPKNILVSNYWNIDLMKQNEIFDTQKGIIRKTTIQDAGIESIDFHGKNINAHKFILNAEKHPKDKGPFSETSIWYDENNELVQFSFNSPKDKSLITIIRSK